MAAQGRAPTAATLRGFGDGVHGAGARIERAPAAVAVGGKRERAARALEADERGVGGARAGQCVGADHVVVLLEDPALDAMLALASSFLGRNFGVVVGCFQRLREPQAGRRGTGAFRAARAIIDRRLLCKSVRGNFSGDTAAMANAQQAVVGDAADFHGVEAPLAEDGEDFLFAAAFRDEQHALLRFR